MTVSGDGRPDPDALLRQAAQEGRGRLKIFLGAAPGTGKTFEMLSEGAARRRDVRAATVPPSPRARMRRRGWTNT